MNTETLNLRCRSDKIGSSRWGVKEYPYWKFVLVNHYTSPILHNQNNLGYNVLYNLLDYVNDKIEKISIEEEIVRNSLHVIS